MTLRRAKELVQATYGFLTTRLNFIARLNKGTRP